jgi:hypothetical protein
MTNLFKIMKNNTLLKKCVVTFFLCLGTTMVFGQSNTFPLKNANWYIGDTWEPSGKARGLDFTGGNPAASINYKASQNPNYMDYMEDNYIASVSDGLGNLLFYTNGFRVWNGNHDEAARVYDYDKTEIIPIPGQEGKYYIMGSRQLKFGQEGALVYSIYDVDGNGGQGATIPGKENIEVAPYMTMRMTSFVNPHDGLPYLVAVGPDPTIAYHEQRLVFNTFYVYKIEDDNGPVLVSPSSSEPGVFEFDHFRANPASLEYGPNLTEEDRQSQIKISPSLTKLGMSHPDFDEGLFMLFDVDVTAGNVSISSQESLNLSNYDPNLRYLRPISIEFSSSEELAYLSYQWESEFPSITTIGYAVSQLNIPAALNPNGSTDPFTLLYLKVREVGAPDEHALSNPHQIQRGIDGRMYVAWGFPNLLHQNMGVIVSPNTVGAGAGFNPVGLFLNNSASGLFDTDDQRIPPLVGDIDNQIRAGEITNSRPETVRVSLQDVVIYPNPSQGVFEVVMPKSFNGTIEVLDVTGRVVYMVSVENQLRTRIDLQKEALGMYFINIISSQETIVKKVLKL